MPGKSNIQSRLRSLLNPVVAFLSYLGITPLSVTIAGIILSLIGAIFVARGALFLGGIVLIVSGLCDTVDGSLARRMGMESTFGAFIDSTSDRVTELAYYGALILYFLRGDTANSVVIVFILAALAGSFLTSYVRARAEGLGLECKVGWLERPERVAILAVGLLLGRVVLIALIVLLAVLTIFTFIQRVIHVRRITLGGDTAGDRGSHLSSH